LPTSAKLDTNHACLKKTMSKKKCFKKWSRKKCHKIMMLRTPWLSKFLWRNTLKCYGDYNF
jgi:hypothetical protein